MNRFDNILNSKISQLDEDAATAAQAANQQITANTANNAVQPLTTQQGQPAQPTQQQPEQATAEPVETRLAALFNEMDFQNTPTALKTVNTALQGVQNKQAFEAFWSSVGYDSKQGFIQPQQATGATPQPGATPTGV